MNEMNPEKIPSLKNKATDNRDRIVTLLILCGVILTAVLMYVRCFYGTELSDEAYYISEAKEMLNGNIPFAVNNSSKALGFTFLIIPIVFLYSLLVPTLEGIFLATRLCFVTWKILISVILFWIFQKKLEKKYALLLIALLLPMSGYFQNFNYDSIPIWLMLLSGTLLYDVIEQGARHKRAELICAGFSAGVACFANPGWGLTLFIFLALMLLRIPDKKEKLEAVLCFFGAVLTEVLIVVIPISMQTSFSALWYGFYRLFIKPFSVESMAPDKNWHTVAASFLRPTIRRAEIMAAVFAAVYALSQGYKKYRCDGQKKPSGKQCGILALAAALFADVLSRAYLWRGADQSAIWAYTAVLYLAVFFFFEDYREEKIFWYLGLYPVVFSVAEIILVDYNASINRFASSFTVFIPLLYALFQQKLRLTRWLASLITGCLILSMGYTDFKYVYRDDAIPTLNYRVESGVYKGIYTGEARSKDLIELETYLNGIIGEDELYAFRDNVPFAYLMTHQGKVCDISTWDYLQYTYHRNSPAPLFDYYRRRDCIPDKIIYIDYGRDEELSIENPDYRYNDWVNAYYDQVDDFVLNETFYHVIVYQYNGTFDGNYQHWIDTYDKAIR